MLAAEHEPALCEAAPVLDEERSLAAVADWGQPKTGRTGSMQRGDVWFAQAVDRELRLRHVRRLTDLDGIDLADEEVMAGTRR